jgi:hypothetical protein
MIHAGHVMGHWVGSGDLDQAKQQNGGHEGKGGMEITAA